MDPFADLAQSVDARFDQVDVRFKQVDARFDAVDARFDAVDTRFDAIDAELKTVARFDEVRDHFGGMRDFTTHCFDKLRSEMRTDFGRVERRLDRHEELLGEVLREVRALRPKSEAPPASPPHPES